MSPLVDDHAYIFTQGGVNAFLILEDDRLTLIDTGRAGNATAILNMIVELGRPLSQLKTIILTHAHPDHIGSAAALAQHTGARILIHEADKAIAERGRGFRPLQPAPGLLASTLFRMTVPKPQTTVEPIKVDATVSDGEVLPIAGGLQIIHAPGHCAGQIAILWRTRRVLFAGDTCTNLFGLGDPIGFEDAAAGRASQARLTSLSFDVACFGHGRPIREDASARFRDRWQLPSPTVSGAQFGAETTA